MRGSPTRAPYSFCDSAPMVGSPKRMETVSLSTSNENRTATRAPLGHAFGLRLRPARTAFTTLNTESSVHSQPGLTPGRGCASAGAPATTIPMSVMTRADRHMSLPPWAEFDQRDANECCEIRISTPTPTDRDRTSILLRRLAAGDRLWLG